MRPDWKIGLTFASIASYAACVIVFWDRVEIFVDSAIAMVLR